MNLLDNIDDELSNYLRSKGLTVTWDFNRYEKVYWYEVYDDDLLIQIEPLGRVPLKDFLEDIVLLAKGKEGTSQTDFFVRGSNDDLIRLIKYLEKP